VKIAINSGIDLAMVPIDYEFTQYLIELVKEGEVPMTRIDEAVTRILQLKYDLGLFDNYVYDFEYYTEFASESHQQAALDAALESITLLKNKDNVLPLAKSSKILVTGPAANSLNILNGAWTHTWQGIDPKWNTPKKLTIMQAIAKEIGREKMTYVEACTLDEATNIDKAIQAAQQVDYIVACVGELPSTEKPGDINDLTLPAAQIELVQALAATNKPIILVIAENRPRIINAIVDKCDAIVMTYLLGDEGGIAVSKTLFGDNNPSGKLPYTYPRYVNDLMTYDHKFAETLDTKFGHNAFNPQFEFGHGLSYTTFAYSDLKLSATEIAMGEDITITITLNNTGKRDGKEVVQVYVRDEYASITPSVKRLRVFEKVSLKVGESETISFVLNTSDLAFIGLDNKPVTEPGFFEVLIADQKARFEVK
jgi:beta-glucosidase